MKKKVFFIVSSLGSGGAERVFWLLSQGFNHDKYDVTLIILNAVNPHLSIDLQNVKVIDLKTIKASRSFFKLYHFIKKEKPYAVFSTAAHINLLISLVTCLVNVPVLIARESNIFHQMLMFGGGKSKMWELLINVFYRRFNMVVCQSEEMQKAFSNHFGINNSKLTVIPNPVIIPIDTDVPADKGLYKKILIVARLAPEKGHDRLLEIFSELPSDYHLTIAGDGPLMETIAETIKELNLQHRVFMIGKICNVNQLISTHHVFALASYTEGFPNAALEALAVGIPVVAFKVGGITELIRPGFNGYIIEQGTPRIFRNYLIKAAEKQWDARAIRDDIAHRFAIAKIANRYQELINF
jgi:glycosyltransferase involved in cell wall biosynthesis